MCDFAACLIYTGNFGLQSRPKDFVESAQSLTPEKCWGGHGKLECGKRVSVVFVGNLSVESGLFLWSCGKLEYGKRAVTVVLWET